MILSALLSFLGGSAFRMIWGEIASFLTKRQDHQHELEAMKVQAELENARAEREMARIKLQAELGVKEIQIQADAALSKTEAEAFVEAMKGAFKPIGIKWVDAWNGTIRPAMATVALLLWCYALWRASGAMGDWDRELVAGILGFYIADRTLAKRGK